MFDMLASHRAAKRLPPEGAIVGDGNAGLGLHETGERMSVEECASSRLLWLLSAIRKHVRGEGMSVPVTQPERSVARTGTS
jgi:hypothetical protein